MSISKTPDPYSIASAFCQYYYSLVNGGHNKLFQLYTPDAILAHTDCFNPFKEAKNITGHDAIKSHWYKSQLAGSKIVISTIDAQSSWNNSVLIICVGDLVPGYVDDDENVPAQKFVQTFVLVPSGKSTYDIFNDYLRFIPDVDDEETEDIIVEEPVAAEKSVEDQAAVEEEVKEVSTPAVPVAEKTVEETPKEQVKEQPAAVQAAPKQEETKEKSKPVTADSTKSSPPSAVPEKDATPSNGTSKAATETSESKPNGEKKVGESAPAKPAAMNWASLAAIGVKSNSGAASTTVATPAATKAARPTVKKTEDKSTTTASNNTTTPASTPSAPASTSSSSQTSSNATGTSSNTTAPDSASTDDSDEFILAGGKKHKTTFLKNGKPVYPVYIKNTPEGISENVLVAFLEEKFGKVDSCRVTQAVALVDFVKSGSQIKAIECHTAVFKGHTMVIEPRTAKPAAKDLKDKKKKPRPFDGDGYKKSGK